MDKDSPNRGAHNESNINDDNIEEFLEILEEHQKNCEAEGKYVEAEMAKNRIVELKMRQEHNIREQLKQKQLKERMEVEEAHLMEFN